MHLESRMYLPSGTEVVSEIGKSQSGALNDIRAQILATNYHCFAVNES